MAGVARLELATVGFGDRCSTNWNYTPSNGTHYAKTPVKGKGLFQDKLTKCSFFAQTASNRRFLLHIVCITSPF